MTHKRSYPDIHVLPEALANKIAAGEVVERPASVIKELVENAIDAEANSIEIYVEKGGKQLLQVVDNGRGIKSEQLLTAFERHATSKISDENDLDNILTLGFRGEALPSIASVSQLEIKTRAATEKAGSVLKVNGGSFSNITKTAANPGTSIWVRQLFFNTPARRKFQKADSTENQQILAVLKRFMLCYPGIAFKVSIDGRDVFNIKEQQPDERVASIYGEDLFAEMIAVENSLGGITIKGHIGKPQAARRSRSHQHLFLNGRPIYDKSLGHAIYQGYGESLEEGSHPAYCLFLTLDANLVDVNIHPTKMQVRFSNERTLYYLFMNTVRRGLHNRGLLADLSLEPEGSAVKNIVLQESPAGTAQKEDRNELVLSRFQGRRDKKVRGRGGHQLSMIYFSPGKEKPAAENQQSSPEQKLLSEQSAVSSEVRLWQVHRRYIISEIKSGLVVIDQHLAHARILFERTIGQLADKHDANSQKLLFPQKITLALDDFGIFKDIYHVLHKIGFTVNVFSGNTIVIEAMPADVKLGRESQILLDVIDYYKNTHMGNFDRIEKIAAAYAYKNAVKTGEELTDREMQSLVDQLFACEEPFFAPNGKPAIITMDLEELSRKFSR